jgi:DNA repair protein RecN (Recombination protein N)
MLHELTITNVAVLEGVTVPFRSGLNVLTGETGAGKSILIDALQLVLGARSSEELLRAGADEAVVQAAFDLPEDPRAGALLEAEGIAADPGEFLSIRRHLFREGKSKAYVNGRLTSAATLRALGDLLVDIHGQHLGQPLLDPRRHREFLDAFAGLAEEAREYRRRFGDWRRLLEEQEALQGLERDRARRQAALEREVEEIGGAQLRADEEEGLLAERAVLANHERLFAAVEEAYTGLEESDTAVLAGLARLAARLREAVEIDPRLRESFEGMATALVHLGEAARELRDYRGRIEFDPARLEGIEARLHEIGRLKRKYGGDAAALLRRLDDAQRELGGLEGSQARLETLSCQIADCLRDVEGRAERLTAGRRRAAVRLQEAILTELAALGMAKAAFEARVQSGPPEPQGLGPWGRDEIEFLIAPNPGEGLKPLHRIASGGELSRIMLAIRVILAEADETPTLIFDEVDAGIGGSMADVVGRKLLAVGRTRQVLCVTHLPQIACFGDAHLRVTKQSRDHHTETRVELLEGETRTHELARMLGGPARSATGVQHAIELLEAASRLKKRIRRE